MNLPLSSWLRRGLSIVSAAALAAGMTGLTASAASAAHAPPHVSIASELSHSAHASQPARTKANSRSTHACAAIIVVGHQSCMLLKRDGLHPILASAPPHAIPARDLAAAVRGAAQRRLDPGGVARPGHGLGDLPAVQDRAGRGHQ
jgi:hypothetical protein